MRHPAYHLRPNKVADRFAFMEAIRRLERLSSEGLNNYTYCGLGGPYLEDFRLLYEFCPNITMVSVENEHETFKRQCFHLPCSNLKLLRLDMASYLTQFDPGNMKSVFWLDYTGLEYSNFEEFKYLLSTVLEESMIKITLRCEPRDYWGIKSPKRRKQKVNEFHAKFASLMTIPSAKPPRKLEGFAYFLQGMLRVAAVQALPPTATTLRFIPVSSFCYTDGTGMFTLTGIVCEEGRRTEVERVFTDWAFVNLAWDRPKLIDVPLLSTKERLHLQHLLPCNSIKGEALRKSLGYLIDDDLEKTEEALEQYAAFHRYSPYFVRGVP